MSKNNVSKNHHYIPQFFLKSFAMKKEKKYIIHVFNKPNLKKFENSVENIAYIKNFHTIKINEKEDDYIEKAHNEIYEKKYSKQYKEIVEKLEQIRQDIYAFNCLSNERYKELCLNECIISNEEKMFISKLLAYFIIRGKKWREAGEEFFNKSAEIIKEMGKNYKINNIKENIEKEIGTIEIIKYSQLQSTFNIEELEKLAMCFYNHIWGIGLNMTNNYFYTSDNVHALTIFPEEQKSYRGIGYATPENIIIFPLTPKICIEMHDFSCSNIENYSYIKLYEKDIDVETINNQIILSSIDQIYSLDGNWKDLDECYKKNCLKKGHKSYIVS